MKYLCALLLCFSSVRAVAVRSVTPARGPTATIVSGVVVGTTTVLPSATAIVHKYLGVPYAAPPERYEPAQEPEPWTTPLNVSVNQNRACYQNYIYNNATAKNLIELVTGGAPLPTESEDCLYLDVFAPAPTTNGTKKAVLFWIYGGSFRTGSTNNPHYDGSSFAANQDVIVVSANYRLNVLGFPGNPQLQSPQQNLGLLDLRRALLWTRQNIGAFGGNPDMITLIGQSAGAAIVDMFISAPPDPLPFRAAIMESGQASYNGAPAYPKLDWYTMAEAVNCTGVVTPSYQCMKVIPAKTLKLTAQDSPIMFGPPIQDGVTWAKQPRVNRLNSTAESSRMARVPILIGSNAKEGEIYTTGVTNATDFLHTRFGLPYKSAAALLKWYPIRPGSLITTEQDRATYAMTESEFTCPAKFVYNDSMTVDIPAWRYFYNASFANSEIVPGAYHASEIPIVFGNYDLANSTDYQVELSSAMQTAWANFAKNPTTGPGWNMTQVALFGDGATPGQSDVGRVPMRMMQTDDMDDRCFLYER
ncbi:Carboxylesterase [Xylariales sp. PMI_506]|nr:Carboxylesterase [Xylariales sp. PMI_506]